jgi:hypothetical protein
MHTEELLHNLTKPFHSLVTRTGNWNRKKRRDKKQPGVFMNNCNASSGKIFLAIIYMLLLLSSSLIPMDRQIRGLQFIIDLKPTIQNLLHVPMYFVLSVFLMQIFPKSQFGTWKRYFLVLLVAGVFGIINEVIQTAVPGRYGGLPDILLNLAGATSGMVFFGWVEKSKSGLMRRIVCG